MFIQPYVRAFVLASLSLPPGWAMGDMLSASIMPDRRGGDEFFFDTFHQHWRLHWEDTWSTFELASGHFPGLMMTQWWACCTRGPVGYPTVGSTTEGKHLVVGFAKKS